MNAGPITSTGADRARRFLRQTEDNRQAVESRLRNWRDRPLAKITAYDSSTRAYSWTEQTLTETGDRMTKDGGRAGTPTWMPAYGFGDGSVLLGFPTEVQLRRTAVTGTYGPVYEFPVYCACAAGSGGVGTQSGAGANVQVDCCIGATIPATLYAHCTVWNATATTVITRVNFPITFNHSLCRNLYWWGYSDPVPLCEANNLVPRLNAALRCVDVGSPGFPNFRWESSVNCYYNVPRDCGTITFNAVFSSTCSPFVAVCNRQQVPSCYTGQPLPVCVFVDMIINTTP